MLPVIQRNTCHKCSQLWRSATDVWFDLALKSADGSASTKTDGEERLIGCYKVRVVSYLYVVGQGPTRI